MTRVSDTGRVKPRICEQFGIDFPLFAFSHCRDVVAAVTNAGGFGVLGATALHPRAARPGAGLDRRARPRQAVRRRHHRARQVRGQGREAVPRRSWPTASPPSYRRFVAELLSAHGIEPEPVAACSAVRRCPVTPAQALLDVALSHPIKLIANALGVPPDYMIEAGRERGVPVAALVGAKEHAVKQVAAGVDLIVAQGTEAGGHCGEVTHAGAGPRGARRAGGDRQRRPGARGGRHRHRQADGGRASRWAPPARGPGRCG